MEAEEHHRAMVKLINTYKEKTYNLQTDAQAQTSGTDFSSQNDESLMSKRGENAQKIASIVL